MKGKDRVGGQIVVEALLALPLGLCLLGLGLDLFRRVQLRAVFHHAACQLAREQGLFLPNVRIETRARQLVESLLAGAAGENQITASTQRTAGRGVEVRLHLRYPAFVRFPWRGGSKHHMEVTQRCFFPIG